MNNKRTNLVVAIANIIAIIAIYVFKISYPYLAITSDMSTLFNNYLIPIIQYSFILYGILAVLNIICAIQNKDNKKLCFWQLIFGLYEIFMFAKERFVKSSQTEAIISLIFLVIIPIILAIVNLVLMRKRNVKMIQIISYVGVIVLSIVNWFVNFIVPWDIIAIIMQFVYIHYQDKNVVETTGRKVINIILYYILQLLVSIAFLGLGIYSLILTMTNDSNITDGASQLYNDIQTLQGSKTEELYIPVRKDSKYGFINENGEEKIPCEYDEVSHFNEVSYFNKEGVSDANSTYYIALAKKDNNYYIITKDNKSVELTGTAENSVRTADENFLETTRDYEYLVGNFDDMLKSIISYNNDVLIISQTLEEVDASDNMISLEEIDSRFIYETENYSMAIQINNLDEILEEESSEDIECNVTITRNNGEEETSTVYLPGLDIFGILDVFSNGYVEFQTADKTKIGWYDDNGYQTTIPSGYGIKDIKDDKAILEVYDEDESISGYMIIDLTGRILLKTPVLETYEDMYLSIDDEGKIALLDSDLNVITDEYDVIVTNSDLDF